MKSFSTFRKCLHSVCCVIALKVRISSVETRALITEHKIDTGVSHDFALFVASTSRDESVFDRQHRWHPFRDSKDISYKGPKWPEWEDDDKCFVVVLFLVCYTTFE